MTIIELACMSSRKVHDFSICKFKRGVSEHISREESSRLCTVIRSFSFSRSSQYVYVRSKEARDAS